ncbi:unnamed protein product [Adineta steineri]|uniref:Uncharacterized protein n=2 Tax=Adineta steineri TaxID=433720 RepID=A0A815MKH7_9BILA|nr:unnamed protein product [Adineta steineri]
MPSDTTSDVNLFFEAAKAPSMSYTSSCSFRMGTPIDNCIMNPSLVQSTSVSSLLQDFSGEAEILFHPLAISTPANLVEYDASQMLGVAEYDSRISTNHLINILNSTTNNQQNLLSFTTDQSMNISTGGIESNDLLTTMQSILQEKLNTSKRIKIIRDESFVDEDYDRFNRINFFLKNIATSMTCSSYSILSLIGLPRTKYSNLRLFFTIATARKKTSSKEYIYP